MGIVFETFGCKVNQYETEEMREKFGRAALEVEEEVYIVNTCSVTGRSDAEARRAIRKIAREHPEAFIVVTGCYAENRPDEVAKIEGVDLVLGNRDKPMIVEHVGRLLGKKLTPRTTEEIEGFHGHTRAFVKIQDGCDAHCSYCIVPYLRPEKYSRPLPEIVEEVRRLARNGYKEAVLVGIHLGHYRTEGADLADVIRAIHTIEGLERIRLSSIEALEITSKLLETIAQLPKVCRHLHIPLQSGSDEVLRRMNRRYTARQYEEIVGEVKKRIPEIGLTTDVIVGFPGEREEDFQRTYDLCRSVGFNRMHVFRYSPREGTPAAKFLDQIDGRVALERRRRLGDLALELTQKFNRRFLGRPLYVLLEEEAAGRDGFLSGYSDNYVKILARANPEMRNRVVRFVADEVESDYLVGRIEE
ncbi:MAG: tRNA (N(6)-L-threonylcarbamoyladenosine(37)-C(2))-methylthiotransferase MtaB [bacterium]